MASYENIKREFVFTPEEKEKFEKCLKDMSYVSLLPYMFTGGALTSFGPFYNRAYRVAIPFAALGMATGIIVAKYVHLKKCFTNMFLDPAFATRYKTFTESKGIFSVMYESRPKIPISEQHVDQNVSQPDVTPTIDQAYDTVPLFSEDISVRQENFFDQDNELERKPLSLTRYEDLRKKNREEYYKNQGEVTQPYKPLSPIGQIEDVPRVYEPEDYPKKTKYGDVWG